MDKDGLRRLADDFSKNSPLNRVEGEIALLPALAGMAMFQAPLLGIASVTDAFFDELRRPGIVGPHFRLPGDWLPTARTVISYFLPFADSVVKSNRLDPGLPSPEWLHARIEGQVFIDALGAHIAEALGKEGWDAVVPSSDERFWYRRVPAGLDGDGRPVPGFTSNWSERHVAHVAGLGTFGLSAGLITSRGIAGRFGSVVTSLPLKADERPYGSFDEYCNYCGACIRRCPPAAISLERRKEHLPCSLYVDRMREEYRPRYGCGKCQVKVPCERGIPKVGRNAAAR